MNLVYGEPAFTFNIPGGIIFNGMFSYSMTAPAKADVTPKYQHGYNVKCENQEQGQTMTVTVNVFGP